MFKTVRTIIKDSCGKEIFGKPMRGTWHKEEGDFGPIDYFVPDNGDKVWHWSQVEDVVSLAKK